jgi:hypothetical protein
MTTDELAGRITAVEVIAMMALGLYLANSRTDPDYQKAGALLAHMRTSIKDQAAGLSPAAQKCATQYGDLLLEAVSQNLRSLRGEGGRLN